MFCSDAGDDEKIFALVPVVVLERFPTEKGAVSISERNVDKRSAYMRSRVKNLRSLDQSFQIAYTNNQKQRIGRGSLKETQFSEVRSNQQSEKSSALRNSDSLQKSGTVEGEDGEEEERPHKCSLCQERFHTSTLLAVHKRIHDQESSEEDDLEINEVDFSQETGIVLNNIRPKDFPVPNTSVQIRKDLSQRGTHGNRDVAAAPGTDRDLIECRSTKNRRAKNCVVKPSTKKNNTKVKSNTTKFFGCEECPASFSRPWYLQLHRILLHVTNEKNTFIECPGCSSLLDKEEHLRQHVKRNHDVDLKIMNEEISSSLRVPTHALTGEHLKVTKKRTSFQGSIISEHSTPIQNNSIIACDWKQATPSNKDIILDLVEAELAYIVSKRNKMGDHFSNSDVQRLALQVTESIHVSNFLHGNPSKRWAQRILSRVGQIPRPGKFRFVHNVNESYLNAVLNLSARGLSENEIYYAFETKLCNVTENQFIERVLAPVGVLNSESTLGDSVSTILCTNANGSVLLYPTLIYQGQVVDHRRIATVSRPHRKGASEFFGAPHFKEWFAQFLLSLPPARPVLLLLEGDVSQFSYSIIVMARENDVHIVLMPSRKRFVHPHRLIRESLVLPLMGALNEEMDDYLETHRINHLPLHQFGRIFDPAWETAMEKAEILKSFLQSGFLPLPTSILPLEIATRDYLDGVLSSSVNVPGYDALQAKVETVTVLPTSTSLGTISQAPASPTLGDKVKLEPTEESDEFDLSEVKQEIEEFSESDCVDTPTSPLRDIHATDAVAKNTHSLSSDVDDDSDDSYTCPICDAEFAEERQLLQHKCSSSLRGTADCSLHSCHICKMSFALKDTLKFHLTMHGKRRDEKPASSAPASVRARARAPELSVADDPPHTRTHAHARPDLRVLSGKRSFGAGHSADAVVGELPPKVRKQVSFKLPEKDPLSLHQGSPSSSSTLTASPDGTLSADEDATFVGCEEGDLEVTTNHCRNQPEQLAPKGKKLPLPPLPEHDYLGQLYQKPKSTGLTSGPKEPTQVMIYSESVHRERISRINITSIASPVKDYCKMQFQNVCQIPQGKCLEKARASKLVGGRRKGIKAVRMQK